MVIKVYNDITQIDENQWCNLLEESKVASFFQSKLCYDFYSTLSFMRPFIFGISEDGKLKGILIGYIQQEKNKIKQYFTKRAIIPGGVLLSDSISETVLRQFLFFCKKQLRRKAVYIEFRNYNDYSKYKELFKKCGYTYHAHLNFHVNTASIEVVQQNWGKSRKRDVKVSLRDGAAIVNNPSIDNIREWYDILVNLYKTRVKTPLFPFEFFQSLYALGIGKFLLVQFQNEIIGGTVCVGIDSMALYEWFACGIDGVYKNIYPSTLATYTGIEYAANHNHPLFDMMGAGKPDEGYGVREFKAKFGGELVEHGRFLCILNSLLYTIGKIGVKVLKYRK